MDQSGVKYLGEDSGQLMYVFSNLTFVLLFIE